MWLLAFDTASDMTTVALTALAGPGDATDLDDLVIVEESVLGGRSHGSVLPLLIQRVLTQAAVSINDIDLIGVGTGPGGYTGMRVGLATADTLRMSLGVDVYGVNTLDALAMASGREDAFIVATNARRRQVYWAEYSSATQRNGDLHVDAIGSLEKAQLPILSPRGSDQAPLEGCVPAPSVAAGNICRVIAYRNHAMLPQDPAEPHYLRTPDVSEPKKKHVVQ
jgi:tRNA threonylcarbamoyl adenosine modification protein YeaZ